MERHLWLTLSQLNDRDRAFLLNALVSPSGLFGGAVNSVVDRFQEVKKQAAAFQQYLPRWSQIMIGSISPNRVQAPHIEKSKNGALPIAHLLKDRRAGGAPGQSLGK